MNPAHPRLFAIVPAAGHSRRMGQPKLLLPYAGQPLISHLLHACQQPEVVARVVVTRQDDVPLQQVVRDCGATVVTCQPDPPDMRTSLEAALRHVADHFQPADHDGWILTPADYPRLSPETIQQLIAVWQSQSPLLLAPSYQGRRGHPLIVNWTLAAELRALPADVGMNRLVQQRHADVMVVPTTDPGVLIDVDDPRAYAELLRTQ